jgi:hypothetical protein
MATIGIRWDGDEPADKDDWERVINEALAETGFTGSVVMRGVGGVWEVESARVGQLPVGVPPAFPDPTDFDAEVEKALSAAGKPVRLKEPAAGQRPMR